MSRWARTLVGVAAMTLFAAAPARSLAATGVTLGTGGAEVEVNPAGPDNEVERLLRGADLLRWVLGSGADDIDSGRGSAAQDARITDGSAASCSPAGAPVSSTGGRPPRPSSYGGSR